MILLKLLESLNKDFRIYGETKLNVSSVADDSRKVEKDGLFVAISGLTVDGHDFIKQACLMGCHTVVGEKDLEEVDIDRDVTYVKVPSSRRALSLMAAAWYGYPSRSLKIIGVTGTDGKTTTASMIYWLLKQAGFSVGLVTSVSAKIGVKEVDTGFHVTNPEPIPLQRFLAEMVRSKLEYAVLEVTSHGLAQDRVYGVGFEVGVLTNITHEHLDYHKSMDEYIRIKAKLFAGVKKAVLNKSDSSFKEMKKYVPKAAKVISYPNSDLDLKVKKAINERFPEVYNRLNAEAACLVAREFGVKNEDIVKGLSTFSSVPGRLEEVPNKRGLKIYIDFAHTPNALRSVLTELKKQTDGKLISVFGCASERDVKKRPVMGKISTDIADFSVITSEDPRREDPEKIIKEIVSQVKDKKKYTTVSERGEAISYAIQKAAIKGDTIVICGKGHEKSMAYNGMEYPWSDFEAVKLALKGKTLKIRR